ncbi:MAG: GNAT family N-acetyltransferase [Candidatus Amulumruptor caecigallinarius]|nr:GNAT family N-acetyltransferase [Candidatus Amulumruptor caecigallinarius]
MIDIRITTDVEELMKWRAEVIRNVFNVEPFRTLLEENEKYYNTHLPDGSHLAIVASSDGKEAGVGSICLSEELPSPDNPAGKCAYLMNIYVREKFRNRGIATMIIEHLVNLAKSHGCGKIYLESTEMAKPLYHECGFAEMKNMMKHEN